MKEALYRNYLAILQSELIAALGCTEPIAIAYASAKARAVLDEAPQRMEIYCSGNIVKNVKGVTVPNSGGMRGIDVAATLGVVGGDADRSLEVLSAVRPEHLEQTRQLLSQGFCQCFLEEGVENLYIRAEVFSADHSASVTIRNHHASITQIVRDGQVIFQGGQEKKEEAGTQVQPDKSMMDLRGILTFADEVRMEDVGPVLEQQVRCNTALADEGLRGDYGAQVGRTLLETAGNDVSVRARARAAAASDARMGGCAFPAVINSGSGNQGITVSVPVVEYAKEWGCSQEQLFRALVVSNLVAIHQKKYIGSLSAYCGAVSAACGAGAGIMYLYGGDYDAVARTITNTLGNTGGIICDGAKSSCAAKIAASLSAAILAYEMSLKGRAFHPGEGLVKEDVEDTIRSVGYVGRVGMKQTDVEVLKIMLDQTDVTAGSIC